MSKHDLTETHEVIGRFIRFEDGDPVRLIFDTASLDRIKQAGPGCRLVEGEDGRPRIVDAAGREVFVFLHADDVVG
jgi:hypothetical protein